MGKAGKSFKKPKQKRYISKKETILTAVIAAVIIIAVIIVAITIHNDDFIRRKNGKYAIGKNWIVANYSKTNTPKYYKIGEVGEIEGYELQDSSENSLIKYIHPADEENADIEFAYVGSVARNYTDVMDSLRENYEGLAEPVKFTCAGRDALFSYYEQSEETTEEGASDTDEEAPAAEGETSGTEEETPAAEEEASAADPESAGDESAEPDESDNGETAAGTAAEETGDETEVSATYTGFAYISYDDSHSVYIQILAPEILSEEQAMSIFETIGAGITLTDR